MDGLIQRINSWVETAAGVFARRVVIDSFPTQSWPEDRHVPQLGSGTTALDVHFSTTDSTNLNEHIFEVIASTVTLEVKSNSDSVYRDIIVEDMNSLDANLNYEKVSSVALVTGIYRLKGNFHSLRATQTVTAASSSKLNSYCK